MPITVNLDKELPQPYAKLMFYWSQSKELSMSMYMADYRKAMEIIAEVGAVEKPVGIKPFHGHDGNMVLIHAALLAEAVIISEII